MLAYVKRRAITAAINIKHLYNKVLSLSMLLNIIIYDLFYVWYIEF